MFVKGTIKQSLCDEFEHYNRNKKFPVDYYLPILLRGAVLVGAATQVQGYGDM